MWVEVKIRGAAPKKGANYFIHEFSAYLVVRSPNLYFGTVQYSCGTWLHYTTLSSFMLREKSRKCNFETLRFLMLLFISIRHVGCVILFYRGGIFVKLCKTLRYLFIREAYSSSLCMYCTRVILFYKREAYSSSLHPVITGWWDC